MPSYTLQHEVLPSGFNFHLERRRGRFTGSRGQLPFDAWQDEMHPGAPLLRLLAVNGAATPSQGKLLVAHHIIASLVPAEAQALELPGPCPYWLRLEAQGAFSDEHFSVRTAWLDRVGSEIQGLMRSGASIRTVAEPFTIHEPLFTLLEQVDRLNSLVSAQDRGALDERMVAIGRVKRALEAATGDAAVDRYLARITISHCTGVAINAGGTADNPTFSPVLYGDVPPPPGALDNEDVDPERQPLLPADQAELFGNTLFPAQGAWSHYTVGQGTYVVLDAPVVAALRVVQRINGADRETRRRFRSDPNSFLVSEIEVAGGHGDVLCGGSALTPEEFTDYGKRVLGVVEWDGRSFSFKIPVHQNWFPGEDGEEVFPIDVPGSEEPIIVRKSEVENLLTQVKEAEAAGAKAFTHHGRSYPLHSAADLIATLAGLSGSLAPDAPGQPQREKPRKRLVLRVAENEEDLTYNAKLRDPDGSLAGRQGKQITGLISIPDQHQRIGIEWLQAAFVTGMPGLLLADDMGLGKTFQVLAFIHWLRENGGTDGRPILVVAPSKLLDEWREQIEIHLPPGALGKPIYAYERGLRDLIIEKSNEMALGRATLDIERLRHSDFVLTTYDTLRDHQFSFAKVRFRVVIFDEAQKIKSGASLINHAAKAQQPDFVILVTGTPVENSTMDMWTLLDVAWPGFLGLSGKDFVARYGDGSDADLMETLKERLIRPQIWGAGKSVVTTPPVMLRRFKADILEGLPAKEERPWQEQMPVEQAHAYDAIIASMQTGDLHPLEALQQLRRICLHPNLHVACDAADRQQVINTSARFRILFRILREAYEAGAGVLVFVDILKAQDVLQPMIRDEFGMQHLPQIINGQTNLRAVGAIKRRFQEGRGFDVLLLGPRAAGFGLNLTRATYVVHLNRWWNPAVEDQCSDRAHRKGQTRLVTVHLPIAVHPRLGEQSFDLVLHGLLTRKRTLSRQIVVPASISQRELTDLVAQIAAAGGALDKELLDALDTRDWRGFEIWVLGRFQAAGWQVSETPRSGDGGVDLIARHPTGRRPVVIQVKHRAMGIGTVGESAVREVADAPQRYQRSHPWLANPILLAVTNGIFDLAARTLAAQRGVRIVDRAGIIGLDGLARELFGTGHKVDPVEKVSSPTQKPHTGLKELDARIEAIELQIRALITSTLGGDPSRLPPHVNQKADERLASAAKKNVTINLKEYRRLPHKLEFCDLRELADSILNKSLWPEFQPLFVNKETFLGKFDQMAELRNGIRHSRTIDAIIYMEGEAGILWFEHVLRKEE